MFLKKILKLKNVIEKEKAKSSYTVNLIFKELFEKNTSEEDYRILLDEDDYLKIYKSYYYLIFAQESGAKIYQFLYFTENCPHFFIWLFADGYLQKE